MNFDDYEDAILQFAQYPTIGSNLTYPVLGLNGEAGEVAEKLKKLLRDKNGVISETDKNEIAKELGDVLWYLTMCCYELDLNLKDVAMINVRKIESRHMRNKVDGSGDNR